MDFASTARFSKKAFSKRGLSAVEIATESNIIEKIGADKVPKSESTDPHISGDEEGTKVLQAVNRAIVAESSDSDTEFEQDGQKRRLKRKKKRNNTTKKGITANEDAIDYAKEIEKYKASLADMSKQLDSSVKAFGTRENNLKRQRDDALDEVNQLRNKVFKYLQSQEIMNF